MKKEYVVEFAIHAKIKVMAKSRESAANIVFNTDLCNLLAAAISNAEADGESIIAKVEVKTVDMGTEK